MIRVFYAFGKSLFNKTSDLALFHQSTADFSLGDFICPKCGRAQDCKMIQPYNRYLITLEADVQTTHIVSVNQVRCDSCSSIHAVLPDVLVPYSSYSLSYILTVLRDYFLRPFTVEALCSKYSIAISTLYAWVKLFHLHKRLWLGLLEDLKISALSFLESLLASDFSSACFVSLTSFSFMQSAFTTLYNSS